MKRSALGIRRSRSYKAEIDVSARYLKKNCLTNFNQTWALAGTYYSECPLHKVKGQGHMTPGFKKKRFLTQPSGFFLFQCAVLDAVHIK